MKKQRQVPVEMDGPLYDELKAYLEAEGSQETRVETMIKAAVRSLLKEYLNPDNRKKTLMKSGGMDKE